MHPVQQIGYFSQERTCKIRCLSALPIPPRDNEHAPGLLAPDLSFFRPQGPFGRLQKSGHGHDGPT